MPNVLKEQVQWYQSAAARKALPEGFCQRAVKNFNVPFQIPVLYSEVPDADVDWATRLPGLNNYGPKVYSSRGSVTDASIFLYESQEAHQYVTCSCVHAIVDSPARMTSWKCWLSLSVPAISSISMRVA